MSVPIPPEHLDFLRALVSADGVAEGELHYGANEMGWPELVTAMLRTGVSWDDDAERYRVSNDDAFDEEFALFALTVRDWPATIEEMGHELAVRVSRGSSLFIRHAAVYF